MTTRPFLPVALHRTYRAQQDRERKKQALINLDSDRLPGVGFLDDPKLAYEEMRLFIENRPELFFRTSWIEPFVDKYPVHLRPAVNNMIGRYLQSVVDVEHSIDPVVSDAIHQQQIVPTLNMGTKRTPSQKQDEVWSMGPFGVSAYKKSNAPSWDTERGQVYLQKRLDFGAGKMEPEGYLNIADELGHEEARTFYNLGIMQRDQAALPKDEGDK